AMTAGGAGLGGAAGTAGVAGTEGAAGAPVDVEASQAAQAEAQAAWRSADGRSFDEVMSSGTLNEQHEAMVATGGERQASAGDLAFGGQGAGTLHSSGGAALAAAQTPGEAFKAAASTLGEAARETPGAIMDATGMREVTGQTLAQAGLDKIQTTASEGQLAGTSAGEGIAAAAALGAERLGGGSGASSLAAG